MKVTKKVTKYQITQEAFLEIFWDHFEEWYEIEYDPDPDWWKRQLSCLTNRT